MRDTCPSCGRIKAITSVSVRKEPPGRRSEPISRKLTVSWLSSGATGVSCRSRSSVGRGIESTGAVWVGPSVKAGTTNGLLVGVGRMVPVGVGKTGWKGVGVGPCAGWKGVAVGLALGFSVTIVNGRACALVAVPQDVLDKINAIAHKRKAIWRKDDFIGSCPTRQVCSHGYWMGVEVKVAVGVAVGKAVLVAVAVGGVVGDGTVAVAVTVIVGVNVAGWVTVGLAVIVTVGVIVGVRVMVGKTIETGVRDAVTVARGVRVGKFGTQMI